MDERKISAMTIALLTLALVALFAALLYLGRDRIGSTEVLDRDAQRLTVELKAISAAHHR